MSARRYDRKLFVALFGALIALAWIEIIVWSTSPYARYLNHELLGHLPLRFGLDYLALLCLFVFGWSLMTVAMMLPTSLPLILLFHRLTHRRSDHLRLVSLLIAGYLGMWTLFGVLAHLGDLLVHGAVHRVPWLEANAWVISTATLMVAGLYQFTPLKYACLDKCRSPLSFITGYWQGRQERRKAFLLGAHHGLYCVGCCWSLMLLMFVVGMTNIAWMLLLGTVMAAEKNLPWGRKLAVPVGILLLASGVLVTTAALAP